MSDIPLVAEAKEHHSEGFQLLAAGSYAKAREQFLKAIEKNPNWAAPHLGLGQTFFFEKKPNLTRAVQSFRRVVELSPSGLRATTGWVQYTSKTEICIMPCNRLSKQFALHPRIRGR